jgi:hypothetical protein
MFRRWSLGLALSVALHAVVVGSVVGWALLRGVRPGAVDIEITGMRMEDLKDLPLGPPPGGEEGRRPRARVRAPAADEKTGTLASSDDRSDPRAGADDGTTNDDGAATRISDLRQLGPEGSRVTMLLRLDRLKATPFMSPVDSLLLRLPDRRDLLDGTGLNLYDDFDALLISTPNPLDYTVTFLAARHHLADGAMRAAVDRGALATDRVIRWRSEGRRPYGERSARLRRGGGSDGHTAPVTRDDRIIVLPAPGLIVVTPPAYRALLLAPARPPGAPDAGAGDGATPDAGVAAPSAGPNWTALLRRIDTEDGLMPDSAIAMVSAVDIFKGSSGRGAAFFMGMDIDVPRVLTAVLGAEPEPFLEVTGEYATEGQARHLEATWPGLQRKLRTNPYLVLSGFSRVIARAVLSRDGNVIHLRQTATSEETMRLLDLIARSLGG